MTVNEDIYESTETFTVLLASVDSAVVVLPSVLVTIIDSDEGMNLGYIHLQHLPVYWYK